MAESDGIRRGHYTTAELAADGAHDLWSERGWPSVAALFKSTPIGAFSTSADDFGLGEIIVSYASGTARVLERSPERIAADGIDILGVGLLLEGAMEGLAASREFQLAAGEILLFDLSRPITMTISDCRSIQVAIPRPLAEANLGPVAALHGTVVPGVAAAPFHHHLLNLRDALDTATDSDAPRLAAALIASLAKTLR
jgi:hypothetical protein